MSNTRFEDWSLWGVGAVVGVGLFVSGMLLAPLASVLPEPFAHRIGDVQTKISELAQESIFG